jgi:hypothetical protein
MLRTYLRALTFLRPEAGRAFVLVAANLVLGGAALLEPVLFGKVRWSIRSAATTAAPGG